MAGTDRCVVRNQAYRKAGLGIRERHNERKNSGYCIGFGDRFGEACGAYVMPAQADRQDVSAAANAGGGDLRRHTLCHHPIEVYTYMIAGAKTTSTVCVDDNKLICVMVTNE